MKLIKIFLGVAFLSMVSSCSLLLDFLSSDRPVSSMNISETLDPITDEIKYTSDKIDELNEKRKPTLIPVANNEVNVVNGIKLSPYLIKTKEGLEYFLQVNVTAQMGLDTNEVMLKCDGKPFSSHKLSKEEKKGVNVIEHSFQMPDKSNFYYQEAIIVMNVSPLLFDYLESCMGDILMRAKGFKGSIDSSIMFITGDSKLFQVGMDGFKSVIDSHEKAQVPKS